MSSHWNYVPDVVVTKGKIGKWQFLDFKHKKAREVVGLHEQ
jgi:predicted fused transcriptional regulator/phosphomethylpyrimidine kinase